MTLLEEIKSALGIGTTRQEDKDTIFGILKQEHAIVQSNLKTIVDSNQPNMDLFTQTADALNQHMKGEEELLYPRLEDNASTRQMAFISYEEHNIAKQILNSVSAATADNDRWMAKIRVLDALINGHIRIEESQVFPKAKEVLFAQTEQQIRQQYLSQKTTPTP